MEPNQIHVLASAVFGDVKQVVHAREPRLAHQILRHISPLETLDRIDDDMAVVHGYRPPTLTRGCIQIRMLHRIRPRRTPSRSALLNSTVEAYAIGVRP